MAQFLDEAAITGVAPAGMAASTAPKGARFLDESVITGRPPEPPTFLDNLAGFLGEKAGEVGAAAKSVGEFVSAGIGMAGGAVAGSAKALEEMAKGKGRREALESGIETSGRVGAALNPVAVATKLLGYEPDPTVLDHVMEKIGKAIHHYGEKVEVGTNRTLLAEDVDLFAQLLMGAGMGKATVRGINAGVKKFAEPPKPGTSMVDMIPKEDGSVGVAPEAPIEATPSTLKSAFDAAKANRPAEISDTAAVESIFAQAKARGLAEVGPTPAEAIAQSKSRISEGLTLKEARAKLDAERAAFDALPTDLERGIAKVRSGQGFLVTPEERIALNSTLKAGGKIVGEDGKPIISGFTEHGKIDPRLLTALGVGSAATWAAFAPEDQERLVGLGILGVTAMAGHGRGSPLGVLLKESAPYTFKTLEMLPKNAVEISRQQITDLLKKPELQAERPVIEQVLAGLPEGAKVNAHDLMSRVLEETAGWKLEPEVTGSYGDYGLENIGRSATIPLERAADARGLADFEAIKSRKPATTLYRLPEHMQISDANHFNDSRLFGWTRSFKEDGVRHVVELQSDLAQHAKGGVKEADRPALLEEVSKAVETRNALERAFRKIDATPERGGPAWIEARREWQQSAARLGELQTKLQATAVDQQLSPIIKNWPRRLIREELLDAAKAGETGPVRFASADTVAKVEGWPDNEARQLQLQANRQAELAEAQRLAPLDEELSLVHRGFAREVSDQLAALKDKPRFRPEHQSIYNRYAGEITRYLKNLGGKEVTDAQGHTWIEVPVQEALARVGKAGDKPGINMLGAADPKLLAGIAAVGGMAAYIAQNPEKLDAIASIAGVGALGAARGKLKGLPESAVIEAARKGDQAAFTQLYLDNAKMIERSLNKYERSGADVQDVLQRTWEKAFNALKRSPDAPGGFKGDSKFSTFVFKIAQNEANRKVVHERARPTTELTPELAESVGHEVTPQREVGNRQLSAQLEAALDKLDPTFREAFILRELDGLPYEDIAAQLDVPIGTVRSRISRAKDQLQKGLREYAGDFGQRGGASPEQLVGLASIAGGATIGGLLDPENSVRNAIYGALAGGALGTGAGRGALKAVIKSPDAAMGLISTRLGNIAPELKFKLRAHELRVLQQTEAMNDAALPFIQALSKLPKDTQARAARALLNGDTAAVEVLPGLGATFPAVQRALASLENQLKVLGRFGEGVSNYFPRIVKDFEGLKAALGQEARVGLEKRLIEAEAKMIRKEGRSLTDIEESLIVNRYLFSPDETSFQPGFAKARRIQDVPESLQKFYEPPTESLLRYLSGAVNDIEIARFFGRDLTTKTSGKKVYNDVDSSIGNLTARLMGEGKLSQAQAMELRDMLKARFEGGEKGMHTALANVRNITNLGLLGNVASAATQIGDSLMTVYHHGLTPTLQAVTEKIVGKERVTPKQLGLINHVAEELSEMGASGRALHLAMKYSGFKAIDMFAKGLGLNAALIKNQKLVSTPEGAAQFRAKYQAAFGDSIDAVITDLRAGRRSTEVDQLAFSELSDAQPISKAEMPELYLAHPNGRLLYQLKTYMLKQTDIVRRDAYQEIAKGTPEGIMRGTKNLAALATVYALANVPGDVVKDLLSGREVDPFNTPRLVENVFQTFGVNRYAGQQLGQGKVVETALGLATPPVRVIQDIAKLDGKSVGYVPLAGRPVADRYFGGNERREIYETRLANRGLPKGTGKPLSPEAKAYLQEKRRKAKEKQYAR